MERNSKSILVIDDDSNLRTFYRSDLSALDIGSLGRGTGGKP